MEFDVSVELKLPWWIKVKSRYNWGSSTVFWRWKLDQDDLPVYAKWHKQPAWNFDQFQERCMSIEYIDDYMIFAVPLADEELESVYAWRGFGTYGTSVEYAVWLTRWFRMVHWKGHTILLGQEDKSLLTLVSIHVFMFYNKGVLTEAFKEYLKVYMD